MKRVFTTLLATSAVLVVSACAKVEKIELKPTNITLSEAGQSATLDAQPQTAKGEPVDKSKAKLEFTSGDAKIATVDPTGKVTAVKSGMTSITVKSGEVTSAAQVLVSIPTTIVVKNAPGTLTGLGSETVLEAEVQDDAGKPVKDARLTFATADANVVAVEGNKLTAKSVGSTTVTASSGKLKQELPVTVKLPDVDSVAFTQEVPPNLKVGDSITIAATAKDAKSANIQGKDVTYTSSDAKIATVDTTGKVVAVKPGSVTIKAESGGKTAEAQITIRR